MNYVPSFRPLTNTANLVNQDATSDSVALNFPTESRYIADLTNGNYDCMITNATGTTLFVKFGTSAVAAVAATDMPVLGGTQVVTGIDAGATHVAAITASGTASGNIYFTIGKGS